MISLCLQCWPGDQDAAIELTALIADMEPVRREETEFFLIYRKDCPLALAHYFTAIAAPKFGRVGAYVARNHDEGWAGGCNMLAASAFIEMTLLVRQETCRNTGFLLFEPDCVPLALDWIDQLSAEWDRVCFIGKEAFGHWHQQGDASTLHMNGNAVWRTTFFDEHPTSIIGAATQGWDYFYREKFIEISCDSSLIYQLYNTYGLSLEDFLAIKKNGVRPVFLHGVKDASARHHVRNTLFARPDEIKSLQPQELRS
jgi:hypothetical protein